MIFIASDLGKCPSTCLAVLTLYLASVTSSFHKGEESPVVEDGGFSLSNEQFPREEVLFLNLLRVGPYHGFVSSCAG